MGKARPRLPAPPKVQKPFPKLKKVTIDDVLVGEIAPVLEAALWNDTGHIKDRYKSWLRKRPGGVVKRGQRTGAMKGGLDAWYGNNELLHWLYDR